MLSTQIAKLMHVPEVDLCESLQQLRAHQPVGAAPQAQQVGDQLQPQVTVAAAAEAHDAVLKSKPPPWPRHAPGLTSTRSFHSSQWCLPCVLYLRKLKFKVCPWHLT